MDDQVTTPLEHADSDKIESAENTNGKLATQLTELVSISTPAQVSQLITYYYDLLM